jgi:hypothetical protein
MPIMRMRMNSLISCWFCMTVHCKNVFEEVYGQCKQLERIVWWNNDVVRYQEDGDDESAFSILSFLSLVFFPFSLLAVSSEKYIYPCLHVMHTVVSSVNYWKKSRQEVVKKEKNESEGERDYMDIVNRPRV